jgi:hypothetical protein
MKSLLCGVAALLVASSFLLVAGCGPGDKQQGQADARKDKKADKGGPAAEKDKGEGHADSDGWWCDEHGVPEAECSQCNKAVAEACKAKGDWCDKHNRAKSQCFLCDPSQKEKFAARYRARYGKEPPPVADEDK